MRIQGHELQEESGSNFFKTIYTVLWDDISIGLLGHATGPIPPAMLEKFEELDVLVGPAGGAPFMEQKDMVRLVKQLNPKIFIPSFFKIPGLKRKAGEVADIAEALNGGKTETLEKFVFKKKDLAEIKKTNLVCLKV